MATSGSFAGSSKGGSRSIFGKGQATELTVRLPSLASSTAPRSTIALAGAPGVWSARWAGEPSDDGRNNQKMLAEMAGVPSDRRTARYRCAAVFVDGRGLEVVRTGTCEGLLLGAPRGSGGFGYDPLFLVPSLGLTMAEIDLVTKNRLSHRAAAFRALARALRELASKE